MKLKEINFVLQLFYCIVFYLIHIALSKYIYNSMNLSKYSLKLYQIKAWVFVINSR